MIDLRALVCLCFLWGFVAPGAAQGPCTPERPRFVFQELERIDSAGEAELQGLLRQLSKLRGWSQSEWESYTLTLSDTPQINKREERRDELMARIFTVLSQPGQDCAALDAIEAEILSIEQQQWDDALRQVREEIAKAPAAGTL